MPTLLQVIGVGILVCIIGGAVWAGLDYYYANLSFSQSLGDQFELADQASQAHTKLQYFNDYVNAFKAQGMTEGHTSLFNTRPRNELSNIYNVTLSLQLALTNLDKTCQVNGTTSFACSNGLQEISITEFCWYPIDIVRSGWLIKNGHGVWANWFPEDQQNRCATASASH